MDAIYLKKLLDVCFTAKHVIETLPQLPAGMKPRHIHVLDRISCVCQELGECRVSDVSEGLGITMPSVTKLVQELEVRQMVEKYPSGEDKRVTLLKLTAGGADCVKKYVHDFHTEWAENLRSVPNEQVRETIRLIRLLDETMPARTDSPGQNGGRK